MHIFLTGEKQVGKSTIVRKFISQSGLSADGFVTYWEEDGDGGRSLYLSRFGAALQPGERFLIMHSSEQRPGSSDAVLRVFDVHGSGILDGSGNCDVIVMDELGFIESKAAEFQKAVMRRISGSVPVLGIIKPLRTEFLDRIRANPNVVVREVTVENRDDVLSWLLENF